MIDTLHTYDTLKEGEIPDHQARAMTLAIKNAESDIALDVKTVMDRRFEEFFRYLRSKFEQIDATFGQINARFKQIDERFAQIDERFAQIDERFSRIDERFSQIDARFDQIDARFDQIDARFDQIDARFNQIDSRFKQFEERFATKADLAVAIAQSEARMVRWMFLFWVGQVAVLAGLYKLMH